MSEVTSPHRATPRRRALAQLLALTSLSLFLGIALCFRHRWDAVAAITIIPIWAWAGLGFTLSAASLLAARRPAPAAATALWLTTLLAAPDEWHSLRRTASSTLTPNTPLPSPSPPPNTLRVLTLNCRNNSLASARHAASWNADIILLQEMRRHTHLSLSALARELWGEHGSCAVGFDTAILAHGRLTQLPRPHSPAAQEYVHAILTRPDGRRLTVASVHLQGHVTSLKLWQRQTWRDHALNQRRHRLSLADIAAQSFHAHPLLPCLIAGDFNSPAGDRTFQTLQPSLQDAFPLAGTGWGNTFPSKLPLLRIDQVWATPELRPHTARTLSSPLSDHRLVLVDFHWP